MLKDLRFAWRQLRKSPAFAITAILTLAIGIGANAAVFSLLDAIVLRPLAVPDMNRVVTINETQGREGDNAADLVNYHQVALGNFEDWAHQSQSFESLAIHTDAFFNLTGAGDAAHVQAAEISPNFFSLLGVRPLLGRAFVADEAQPGRDAETVLSYGFWQRRFGGNPGTIGQRVELDGRAYSVIGVMPRTLDYPSAADLFVPLAPTADQMQDRTEHDYAATGRLRRGVSIQAAQAELQGIATRLAKQYPATNLGWGVTVLPLLRTINGPLTPLYLRLIMGATLFVLLIVCANVANLQFARGLGRRNEMAVRTALGAQRRRLLRQLLAESVLLGLAGAFAGLVFAGVTLKVALYYMPERIARYVAGWGHVSLNLRALELSILLAVTAALLSGLAPALQTLKLNLVQQLKAGGRTATGTEGAHRLRNLLAVAQIALAVLLVIGAALMSKGLYALIHRSDNYSTRRMLTFNVNLPEKTYGTPAKRSAWYADSLSRIRALPGVRAVAVTTTLPEGNDGAWEDDFRIDNRPEVPGNEQRASRLTVSAEYFSALHIPLVDGRNFNGSDGLNTMPVAIVSRKFAEQNFPGTSALGHRIRMGVARKGSDPETTIIGIAGDVRYLWLDASE